MSDEGPASPPVFVDVSGRRRRTSRMVAVVCTAAALAGLVLVAAALFGAPLGPLTVLPTPTVPTAPPSPSAPHRPAPDTGLPGVPGHPSASGAPVVLTDAPGPATTVSTPPGNGSASSQRPSTPGHGSHGTGRPTDLPSPPGRSR